MNLGCLYARADSLSVGVIKSLFDGNKYNYTCIDSLYEIIKRSYLLQPKEPIFALNYALVVLLKRDYYSALDIIKPFACEQYATREVLVIAGLLNELIGHKPEAQLFYSKTITQYPDVICSLFFKELCSRDSVLAFCSKNEAIHLLEKKYHEEKNPIVASKLGSLLYNEGNKNRAETLLTAALDELPTLNRAIFYLGCIKEDQGNFKAALDYYFISYSLDKSDLLPLKKLVDNGILDSSQIAFIKRYKYSDQSYRLEKIYGGKTLRSPYIISDLEQYLCETILE